MKLSLINRDVKCPSCQYVRQAHDERLNKRVCPACGIVYSKWLDMVNRSEMSRVPPSPLPPLPEKVPLAHCLWETFFFVPSDRHESAFWGHVVLFAFFFIYGVRFILHGIDVDFIGTAFIHYPNLAIHEFGHLIFRPFGDFVMFLGGSLFQILFPLGLLLFFSIVRQENFAAAVMLWWTGQNFIDVSPYIQDAPQRLLPLVGGGGAASHDWYNILGMSGQLGAAQFYADLWFAIGVLLILLSFAWSGMLFYIELLGREVIREEEPE